MCRGFRCAATASVPGTRLMWLNLISNQPMSSATLQRTVWSQVCFWAIFFGEWRKLLVQGEIRYRRDVGQSRDAVKIGVLLTYRGSR